VTVSEGIRLQKFLSLAGRASRREAEGFIVQGRVRVNGVRTTELGTRVIPGADRVEVDGEAVDIAPGTRWFAFHKPAGLLTTRSDPHGGATIFEGLPLELRNLKYVGRLDRDTEGLLILSDDGDMIHRLTHPSGGIEREYLATVARLPSKATLHKLRNGVVLGDGPAVAKRAELVGRDGKNGIVSLVITEGRKREVRRMFEAVGHPVRRLIRVRFGVVELGDLPMGATRPLASDEIERLRRLVRGV
jgi:23S rRNA pseudouridine2605 synthase